MFQVDHMKGKVAVLVLIGAGVVAFWWWFGHEASRAETPPLQGMPMAAAKALEEAARRKTAGGLPGERILQNYAADSSRPQDDLNAMAHVFSNLALLVKGDAKGDAPFRMGANEEFAAALLGKNAAREVFLTLPHACLNEKGQLVDRWGSPLFFHVRDASRTDIRSAGPDREMWTADDLHRTHEGEFVRGEKLPEPGRR